MNLSGQAVAKCLRYFSLAPENVIAVHDDADLDWGRIDVKKGGGSGGHRGIESIVGEIDSKDFTRVRMGIGRSEMGNLSEHVLSQYGREQKKSLLKFLSGGVQVIDTILQEGLVAAMNRFNGNRLHI
jgi:PTH1 family peptidyl-tRNA hydrolase